MAILVNTSRTVRPEMSDSDKSHYTVGVWPFHKGHTIADITPFADVIIGVTGGVITVVKAVEKVVLTAEGDRFEILPKADDEIDESLRGLIGKRIAPDFAWKPGQGWPVKLVDTVDIQTAHKSGPPEVALAGYRLTVDVDGTAHLYLPRGGDVHVHASA